MSIKSDGQIYFRVPKQLKSDFEKKCNGKYKKMTNVLIELMLKYIKED